MMEKKENVSPAAEREETVLVQWENGNIFEKSLEKEAPNGEFVFYDGPPFATGLPHTGSLLSSVIKDAVGRYKTMRGYRVPRRWGWDCHGLPIENMIEKKLNLKTKKDIEELGIDVFNEEAKQSVLAYADEWKAYVERIGRWVHFDNSYKTMDNTYIESVWWALKKIYDDKRLYEGKKVLMYCPRCETPLSKAEIAMDNSYEEVTEEAVFVKFKLEEEEKTYILAWTTTPWTLPGNVALAVNSDFEYRKILFLDDYRNFKKGETYIAETSYLAKELLGTPAWEEGSRVQYPNERILSTVEGKVKIKDYGFYKGENLAGRKYTPLYTVKKAEQMESKKAWTVLPADFVTTEEGTGIVHIAPMYGEDDYNLGLEHGLPVVPILDATGTYNNDAPELLQGLYYKKGGKKIVEDLEKRELLFKKHTHTHSYPHCYRCGTPLIYNALSSWFIDIQSVKKRLLEANEDINWYPDHLKHGRFKNIVETAPDWTISRNRFWASPLPIWKHEETGAVTVIGSLKELREKTKKSGNRYLFIRHGEAESNIEHIISSLSENEHHVTEQGKRQIQDACKKLRQAGITKLIASPFLRTKESAELIAKEIGFEPKSIIYEDRFKEWQLGDLNNKPVAELRNEYKDTTERFTKRIGERETLLDMKRRIGAALYELDRTYRNETILVVGHEYTLWLAECVAQGASVATCIEIRGNKEDFAANGEMIEIDFVPLPHNKEYELDFHRPYIDRIELISEDGKRLVRVPEVVDCWVESSSMPFASEHYPHENRELVERRYPGDFIAEYIAQTRTWFYYMHAMGVLLFDAPSFKNCVTTGTLLAADGAKISKSKRNYTDPMENINRYGADAMRFYMLGSVVMAAEDVAFKDEELRDVHNRFINMLWNSFKFYEMHADKNVRETRGSDHVLDRWILARLDAVVIEMTERMDAYDTVRSARALREFVSDLSQWYIRRSRNRFKSEDKNDRDAALSTARYVFVTVAKLIAPITPFIAESIYRGVGGEKESVHLEMWPETSNQIDEQLLTEMAEVRRLASLALEQRQSAGIKVRQPLASLSLTKDSLHGNAALIEVLLDEINVKEFLINGKQDEEILLDTTVSEELREEGLVRDAVRAIQDIRKKMELMPEDGVTLVMRPDKEAKNIIEKARIEIQKIAGVKEVRYEDPENPVTFSIDGVLVSVELKRIT